MATVELAKDCFVLSTGLPTVSFYQLLTLMAFMQAVSIVDICVNRLHLEYHFVLEILVT